MRFTQIYFLLFVTYAITSCYGSINSHFSKLGYIAAVNDVADTEQCFQEATCKPVQNATCFGTALPYGFTSVALAEDSMSQFDVQDNLALWQGLRSVPRCWAVVQPLLCAVYMPKCENGLVSLPSQDMCRITREPCKSVEVKHAWPSFLRCENKKLFPSHCRNPLREVKFNTSYKCISPLVETDNADNWFLEVEGCGIQCQDPFFTSKEHDDTHHLIGMTATISCCLTLFAVATFIISWKSANCYPGVILFYINLCLTLTTCGWLIQFLPGARKEIVCRHDGTIRRQQPQSGEHLCSITFVLIYYFLMAAVFWFVILCYTWHVFSRKTGSTKNMLKKKMAYFHLGAWSLPLVLTTFIMAVKEIDGDSMSGICFVGYSNINARVGFVLAPIGVAALMSFFFLISALYNLIKVKLNSEEVTNVRARKKLSCMIYKISISFVLALFLIICTFGTHAYDFIYRDEFLESLRDYIVCLAMNSAHPYSNMGELPMTKCALKSKPSLRVLHLQLVCLLVFSAMMSSWVWTKPSIEAWKRFFFRLCEPSAENVRPLRKHELIAKAYQQQRLNQRHLSSSLNSTYDNPVSMIWGLNSLPSTEISSTFAKAVPGLLVRRNAVSGRAPFPSRYYSSASDISRQISRDSSNQQNPDCLSLPRSNREYAVSFRHRRPDTSIKRDRFQRVFRSFHVSRRGSDSSSLQSSFMASAAPKILTVKVTKSTSTGDLGIQALPNTIFWSSHLIPPTAVQNTVRQKTMNHPFTHGMTDNSNRLERRPIRSTTRGPTVHQRLTPYPIPASFQNPLGELTYPPMYGPGYGMNIPHGYIGDGMYQTMNGIYPEYSATNYNCLAYNAMPCAGFGPPQTTEAIYQYQQGLITEPRIDSASETKYFPIIMSDSEYADTDHQSYDETQFLSAPLMQQELLNAQALPAPFFYA